MKSLILLAALGVAIQAFAEEPEWKITDRTKDGIIVYRRRIEGSDVVAFRGEGDVETPINRVATIIFDSTRGKEWIEDLEESRILRWSGPSEFIEYDHIGTPFVMKDRDFVTRVTMVPDGVNRTFTISYKSVDDASAPKTSYVRGDMIHATFVLTDIDGKRTHVDADIHCDPKGSVPKWIVNFFQKDWPVTTFRNLRRQAAKTDVVVDPRFAELFKAPPSK